MSQMILPDFVWPKGPVSWIHKLKTIQVTPGSIAYLAHFSYALFAEANEPIENVFYGSSGEMV